MPEFLPVTRSGSSTRLVRLKPLGPGPDTARYNENLQSRTTLGPEISREKICGLLKLLPQSGPGPEGPAVTFMPQGPDGPWSGPASNSWKLRAHASPNQRNPLKFAGVHQTCQQISADSRPTFTILRGHVEEICSLTRFFPIVNMCLNCEDMAWQSCAMVSYCI